MTSTELPWSEAFKPKILKDITGHADHVKLLQSCLETRSYPCLLLFGKPGIGKSCAADCYLNEYVQKYSLNSSNNPKILQNYVKHINASMCRSVGDLIDDQLLPLVKQNLTESGVPRVLVILEEADNLLKDCQELLKTLLDQYSHKLQLLILANDVSKIIEPLRNKCIPLEFHAPDVASISRHLRSFPVFPRDYSPWSEEAVALLIECCDRDLRKCCIEFQSLSLMMLETKGNTNSDILISVSDVSPLLPYSKKMWMYQFLQHLYAVWIQTRPQSIDVLKHAIDRDVAILNHYQTDIEAHFSSVSEVFKWLAFWLFEYEYDVDPNSSSLHLPIDFREALNAHLKQHFLKQTAVNMHSNIVVANENKIHLTCLLLDFMHL